MGIGRLSIIGFGLLLGAFAVGCSTGDSVEGDEQDITPDPKGTLFEQAQLCDALVRDKVGVRDADLKSGVLRWKCGDVDGVTYDAYEGAGFGQEYCEYHAVANGRVVDGESRPQGDSVQCVFTSVFTDSNQNRQNLTAALRTAMGVDNVDPMLPAMRIGFNSRGAAITLINDCESAGTYMDLKNAERQVACLNAWKSASPEDKRKLRSACLPNDLSDESAWAAVQALGLGVKELTPGSPDYEVEMDIAACTQGLELGGAIVSWRNSDPTICARAMRASRECGATFNSLPDALDGFSMTAWVDDYNPSTPPQAPVGCKYAEIDGKPYDKLLVCSPSADKVAQAKLAGKPMQTMCKEEFGSLIAMAAPIGAVTNIGPKQSPFCDEFHAGARALQGASN